MSKRKFQTGETAIVNSKVSAYDTAYNKVSPGTEVKSLIITMKECTKYKDLMVLHSICLLTF